MDTSDSTTPTKRCSKCKRELPATIEYFYQQGKDRPELRPSCKECLGRSFVMIKNVYLPKPTREGYKRCTKCEQEYPATTEYWHRDDKPDGLATRCKSCRCKASTGWRWAHIEQVRKSDKARIEKFRERARQTSRLRRSRRVNALHTFTRNHERLALEYFHHCCAVCGRQLKDLFGTSRLEWDHWIPLSKGGNTTPSNMLPLCGAQCGCNGGKGTKLAADWLRGRYSEKRARQIEARVATYFEWIKSQG